MGYIASKRKHSYCVSDNMKLSGINVLLNGKSLPEKVKVKVINSELNNEDTIVNKETKLRELGDFVWINFSGISVTKQGENNGNNIRKNI